MAVNLNVVALTGNLTSDPDLRQLSSGTMVCKLRLAVNGRRKVDGEWVDRAGFFDIVCWGAQGENCARYLSKGRPVAVQGRLEWREWQDKEGNNRQTVDIVAETVQFLGDGSGGNGGGGGNSSAGAPVTLGAVPSPAQPAMPAPAPVPGVAPSTDDDIPF